MLLYLVNKHTIPGRSCIIFDLTTLSFAHSFYADVTNETEKTF
jgi:hypothetical protein